MKITYTDETGRNFFTAEGAAVYCSAQATADVIAKLERKISELEEEKHVSHKYLNDLGISSDELCIFNRAEDKDERKARFKEQRKTYGFDDRETWSLDYTLIGWLYSHLKMFAEIGGEVVDFSFYKFKIPVLKEIPKEKLLYDCYGYCRKYHDEVFEEHTEQEAIDICCEYLKFYLINKDECEEEVDVRKNEHAKCALKIVAEILPALWW